MKNCQLNTFLLFLVMAFFAFNVIKINAFANDQQSTGDKNVKSRESKVQKYLIRRGGAGI